MALKDGDIMTIWEKIKYYREKRGMTQGELAKKVGYTDKSTISKIESDGRRLTQTKIVAFAHALGVTPGTLMGWEEIETGIDLDVLVKAVKIAQKESEDNRINELLECAKRLSDNDLNRLIEIAKMWGE